MKNNQKIPFGDIKAGVKERDLYPSPFLKADDFEEDRTLTINRVRWEEVVGEKGRKDNCVVIYFKEEETPMILNKTNFKTVKKIYGITEAVEMIEKKITLYAKGGVRNPSTGEDGDAIRVRPVMPQKEKLNADRYTKMIEAIKAGKFDKNNALDRFDLTPEQRKVIEAL